MSHNRLKVGGAAPAAGDIPLDTDNIDNFPAFSLSGSSISTLNGVNAGSTGDALALKSDGSWGDVLSGGDISGGHYSAPVGHDNFYTVTGGTGGASYKYTLVISQQNDDYNSVASRVWGTGENFGGLDNTQWSRVAMKIQTPGVYMVHASCSPRPGTTGVFMQVKNFGTSSNSSTSETAWGPQVFYPDDIDTDGETCHQTLRGWGTAAAGDYLGVEIVGGTTTAANVTRMKTQFFRVIKVG